MVCWISSAPWKTSCPLISVSGSSAISLSRERADLMRDPIKVMRSLYDWAGDELRQSTEQAMADRLQRNPQDRFGLQPYSLDGSTFDVELEKDQA
jgi:hypothetical protein